MKNLDSTVEIDTTTELKSSTKMEPDVKMAKKLWHIVRVAYFMLKKGMSKGKLMLDLKLMILKRQKLDAKINAISSALSAITAAAAQRREKVHENFQEDPPDAYEFSCSNSPVTNVKKCKNTTTHHSTNLFSCVSFPAEAAAEENEDELVAAVDDAVFSCTTSPALPGFGKTPMVRQLRITDSPLPYIEEDSHVDEAAEEFIEKFYKEMRRRNAMSASPK